VITLKICIISKYPPIEGEFQQEYTGAKALGERGHEVHIVTNAQEAEEAYKERIDTNEQEYTPQNVYVHSTTPDTNSWHIPFLKTYTERIGRKIEKELVLKYLPKSILEREGIGFDIALEPAAAGNA
jgi:hypothetical protein